MAMQLTTEITRPTGATTEQQLDNLVKQLQRQNAELKAIISDIYREIRVLQGEIKKLN